MKLFYSIFLFLFLLNSIFGIETCSRIAIINHQEILIDTNSTDKGEGLRFYIEKDEKAKAFLETYQEGTKTKWQNAVIGTAGTSLMLGGLFSSNSKKKQTFLISGATLIILNFLVARTLEKVNENNLEKAIEEYNKRNLPKIYFNQEEKSSSYQDVQKSYRFTLAKSWSF